MIDPAKPCVVDASVGIKLLIAEELSDQAALLFDLYTQPGAAELAVPDLFFVECANILWKHVRKFGYLPSKAQSDIQALDELMLTNYSTQGLSQAALELALARGITAYDACYVALAHQLDCPLVTADHVLQRALADSDYQVLWLGDLDFAAENEQ